MMHTLPARLLFSIVLTLTLTITSFAYDLQSAAEDMDNYFIPAYPPFYGEILDRLPPDEVSNISAVLKGLEIFGYLKGLGDVALKLDAGDTTGAALDSAFMITNLAISKLKDEATKKIFFAGVGVATLPLTALVTTLEITRKSYEAVAASQTALNLERLTYSIQFDPVLKIKGRKLGEGDPIRIDPTTIEHLWRKVLNDEQWRGLFKSYVTNELGRDWPEPSTWEQWTIGTENLATAKLLEDRNVLKSYIAGLLNELNKVAQKEESRVILAQQLKEIEAIGSKLSKEELEAALRNYHHALKQLPAIELYVSELPALVAKYSDRIATAPVTELVNIREKEIISTLGQISSHAQVVRLLPSVGRNASKRQELLTNLKKGYGGLAGLINAATRAEINSRLIAESKKLEVSGTEFTFTRHECSKIFEDVKETFENQVVRGAADSGAAVGKAKEEIYKVLEQISKEYGKDWDGNKQSYTDKLTELNDQLQNLKDRLAQTSDYKQRELLQQAISALQKQITQFNGRYESYTKLHQMNAGVDFEICQGALTEIDVFVRENSNRQAIVQKSLVAEFSDARQKYSLFFNNHQVPYRSILSESELDRLEAIIRDNPDTYAGLSFEFLKKHLVNEKDAPRSRNILQTVTGMADALMTYSNTMYSYRIPYYSEWLSKTIPSLVYMESKEPREAIKVVQTAIESATASLRRVDRSDFSETFKPTYDQMMAELPMLSDSMTSTEKLLSKASGLSDSFIAYNDRALSNNVRIAEDSARLTPVLRAFHRAKSSLSINIAMFIALSQNSPTRVLSSGPIFQILEDTDVLFYNERLQLGIEELIKEPFLEMQGKNGLTDIYLADFKTLTSIIKSAPVNEYSLFYKKLYAVADEPGGTGIVMERLLRSGNTFPEIFKDEPAMAEAATKLYKLFMEQREVAGQNQSVIDNLNARFEMVLYRVNQLLQPMQEKYDAGDYMSVGIYSGLIIDVQLEYKSIGSTRQDVDAAFAKVKKLMDDAISKSPFSTGTGGGLPGGPVNSQEIKDFYQQFKTTYESRDDSRIMSFMGDDWEAGDGTTLADMQVNLSRMFRKFDELKMTIDNLQIFPIAQGFMVNYDVTISSRIYNKNLRHQEKSSVREQVSFGENGKPRIVKTLNGRYWFVE